MTLAYLLFFQRLTGDCRIAVDTHNLTRTRLKSLWIARAQEALIWDIANVTLR